MSIVLWFEPWLQLYTSDCSKFSTNFAKANIKSIVKLTVLAEYGTVLQDKRL